MTSLNQTPSVQLLDFIDCLDDRLDRAHAVLMLVCLAGQRADEFAVDHAHAVQAIALAEELVGEARKTVRALDAWRSGADQDLGDFAVSVTLTAAEAAALRRAAGKGDPEELLASIVRDRLVKVAEGSE